MLRGTAVWERAFSDQLSAISLGRGMLRGAAVGKIKTNGESGGDYQLISLGFIIFVEPIVD